MCWLRVRLTLPILLFLASPAWANYSILAGDGFTYCHYDTVNIDGETCSDSDLGLGRGCSVDCSIPGNWGYSEAVIPWEAAGFAVTIMGDAYGFARTDVKGRRSNAATFHLGGGVCTASPREG